MDHPLDTSLRIATAEGPGSGQFLARALLDAIDGGGALRSISIETSSLRGAWAIDFVFDHEEVIRAGLAASGEVVSTELFRAPGGGRMRAHRKVGDLADALRAAGEIVSLRLESGIAAGAPRNLVFLFSRGEPFALDMRAFGPPAAAAQPG